MKSRKAVLFGLLAVIIVVFLVGLYFILPRKIIDQASDFSLTRITYKDEDVTALVDESEIAELLHEYGCRRTIKNYFPYETSDVIVEIDARNKHRPLHILLGKFYISYESADRGACEIIEGDKLLTAILTSLDND